MTPPRPGDTPRIDEADARPLLVDDTSRDASPLLRLLLGLLAGATAVGIGLVGVVGGDRPALLPLLVADHLEESGVSNPVTAVLLNFRGYDTLLEIAVLLAAMAAVWSLDRGSRQFGRPSGEPEAQPVLEALIRVAVPVALVTSVYLTWVGSTEPGGAFQAGALLAGGGVLLTVSGLVRPPTAASATVRAFVAGGVAGFVLAGLVLLPITGAFLAYPEGWAYPMIVAIEVLLTLSIAVVLVELFVDVPAVPDPDPSLDALDSSGDPLGRALAAAEREDRP